MTSLNDQPPQRRNAPGRNGLAPRRLALLASVAGLGAVLLLGGPGIVYHLSSPATAQARAAQTQAARPASFADIVDTVKPAVVSVRVKLDEQSQSVSADEQNSPEEVQPFGPNSPFNRFFRNFENPGQHNQAPSHHFGMAQGSGFFISADGYVVTNNHVVDHATSVEVTTDAGKTYTARVLGTDPKTDVALLKVDGANDFPHVTFADNPPRVGDWVLAVGNPFGLGGTVTAGIVSARGRDIGNGPYDDFIQIDAPVNKGNSGGPAFDENGNVVGVTTAIYSPSGGSIGIGFAIPADTVKTVVAQLKDKGSVTRGWLGVEIQSVTADVADSLGLKQAEGALVADPQPGGPAAKAGLAAGDVVVSVNGHAIKDAHDLARTIAAQTPGSTAKLGVIRNGAAQTMSITLGNLPNDRQATIAPQHGGTGGSGPLGLTVAPASQVAGAGHQGVVVTNVNPDGPAAAMGFRSGDVILDVAGKGMEQPAQLRQALQDARQSGKHHVLMRVKSGDATRFVAMPLDHAQG